MPLSVRDMAAALGVSKSQVQRDKADGMPMSDAAAARTWRLEHRDLSRSVDGRLDQDSSRAPKPDWQAGPGEADRASPGSTPAAGDEPDGDGEEAAEYRRHRAAREKTNAERAQLELEQLRGRLIDVDDAKRLAFTSFRAMRDAVLNVPARVAAQCAAETDVLSVEQLIDAEITAALGRFDPARLLKETEEDTEDEAG